MKAVLEFNLPEDGDDFRYAINGEAYREALYNIKEDVRQIWKYNSLPQEQFDLVDRIYQMICQRIKEGEQAND